MPFAEINGAKINYIESGEGEPVLLITGFGGDINFFHSLIPALADDYRVIAFEPRGSGQTVCGNDFTYQTLTDDVDALMAHLNIQKFHLLGWSLGSQIAMEYAIQHQDKLLSLALVSAYMHAPARSSYMMNKIIDICVEHKLPAEYICSMTNSFCFTEDYFNSKREKGQCVRSYNDSTPEKLKQQMKCLDSFDLRNRMNIVKVPVMSIHGLDDIMVEPKMGDAIVSEVPHAKVLRIPSVGHVIHPSLYAQQYKEFLDENSKH